MNDVSTPPPAPAPPNRRLVLFGDLVTTSVAGVRLIYANGWTGVYDVRTEGRFDRGSWRGTLSSTMVLRYHDGPAAVCHSDPVSFDLR